MPFSCLGLRRRFCAGLPIVCLFSLGCIYGQEGSLGSLTGTVTDPSGAAIPGANVTAVQVATNVETKTQTTSDGLYRLTGLAPGVYNVTVSKAGFRPAESANVPVRVAQLLTVNFSLQVGQATQSVEVNAEAPLVEASSSQLSHYVTPKEMETWPVAITGDGERQLQDFIFKSLPGTTGETLVGSINGGQNFSNEVYLDGISMGTFDTAELGPSMDAVSEFNLQTGAIGAQYSGGSTAVTNFSIKSGTNQLHGTAYYYLQNEAFDANSFVDNAFGVARPKQRLDTMGGAVGGPVYIPKIYNGKNKTFFFFSDEATDKHDFILGSFTTLPTASMLQGNLSAYLNPLYTQDPRSGKPAMTSNGQPVLDDLGRPVIYGQIYNPATSRTVTAGQVDAATGLVAIKTGLVRDPFPGNIIPAGMINSVAANYLKIGFAGAQFVNSAVINNVAAYAANLPVFSQQLPSLKIDHILNDKNKLSSYFTITQRARVNVGGATWSRPGTNPLDTWDNQNNPGRIIRLSEDWTISPTLVNHIGVGYNSFTNAYDTSFYNQDWAGTLGIPNTAKIGFPSASFSGPGSLGGGIDTFGNGSNGGGHNSESRIGLDQLTMIHGSHTLQAGFEARYYADNSYGISGVGSFAFSNLQTDDGFSTVDYAGNAFASFLLGQVNTTGRTIHFTNAGFRRRLYGTFLQDSWKVSSKLTLNLGLRWEVMGGIYEVAGRFTEFNPTKPNPGAGGLPGALDFASQDHILTWEHADPKLFSPRLGFAYAMFPRLVIRGGYAINTQAPEGDPSLQFQGVPSILGYNGQISINHATVPTAYPDLPTMILGQPFPSYTGPFPNYDPSQSNGTGPPEYVNPNGARVAYTQNYTFGFQYQLNNNSLFEANYVGNYSSRLNTAFGTNSGALGVLDQLPYGDIARYGDALLDPLSAHPNIPIPYPGFNTGQAVQQALVVFPQYPGGSIYEYDGHEGWSNYNSLQLQFTRRVSEGFSILGAYTWSKVLTDTNGVVQDIANRREEKAVATGLNYPSVGKFTWIYDLPVGPGRLLNIHGWMNTFFGGWTLSGNMIYQSGDVLAVSDSAAINGIFSATRPDYVLGQKLTLGSPGGFNIANPSGPTGSGYLNPSAFAPVPTTCDLVPAGAPCNGIALRSGTAPNTLPNVRGPWLAYEGASILKAFRFGEKRDLQFRAEVFNLFNRAGKGDPVTDINNPQFGQILGPGSVTQSIDSDSYFYQPRVMQLSLRVHF